MLSDSLGKLSNPIKKSPSKEGIFFFMIDGKLFYRFADNACVCVSRGVEAETGFPLRDARQTGVEVESYNRIHLSIRVSAFVP